MSWELADRQVDEDDALRELLVAARIEQGISQADLAESIFVPLRRVVDFESGDLDPSWSFVRRYAFVVDLLIRHETVPGTAPQSPFGS